MTALPTITELVPHRPPMLWLDAVCEGDDQHIVCRAVVRSDSPFVRRGRAAAVVTLEFMAQAAAALLGWQARRRATVPGGGYLVAVPTFDLFIDDLAVGDVLEVHATQLWPGPERPAERLVSLGCKVVRAGTEIASATLNVVRSETDG